MLQVGATEEEEKEEENVMTPKSVLKALSAYCKQCLKDGRILEHLRRLYQLQRLFNI
jgi:hypothetical protein